MMNNESKATNKGQDRLLTQKELAVMLAVSARTVRRLTRSGELPCVRLGRRLPRYRLEEVLEALHSDGRDCLADEKTMRTHPAA